ncbi:Germin-like protein 12-1, partial [Mucuna pruriens]
FVNGKFCKDSKLVKAEDFFLHVEPGNTANSLNAEVTPGDVFVFPIGLIHFQLNVGYGNAIAIAALSSQNPGTITVAKALFKSTPPISSEVLTKAFQVDKKVIDYLQKQSWYNNN